jgi:hypothetical protein
MFVDYYWGSLVFLRRVIKLALSYTYIYIYIHMLLDIYNGFLGPITFESGHALVLDVPLGMAMACSWTCSEGRIAGPVHVDGPRILARELIPAAGLHPRALVCCMHCVIKSMVAALLPNVASILWIMDVAFQRNWCRSSCGVDGCSAYDTISEALQTFIQERRAGHRAPLTRDAFQTFIEERIAR